MELPEITPHIKNKPSNESGKHFIPDFEKFPDFWHSFFYKLSSHKWNKPIEEFEKKINPYFGYYGLRWHPINFSPSYFHAGIDINTEIGTPIYPITNGFLEYSGYAPINGNYIIIKHPHIYSKDGFILRSLYMHCSKIYFKFLIHQKLIREFLSRKNKLANVKINKEQIGSVGNSGNILGLVPHLHLQLEFVNNSKIVVINPLRLYKINTIENLTSNIDNQKEFQLFYTKYKKELSPWMKFWDTKIKKI